MGGGEEIGLEDDGDEYCVDHADVGHEDPEPAVGGGEEVNHESFGDEMCADVGA